MKNINYFVLVSQKLTQDQQNFYHMIFMASRKVKRNVLMMPKRCLEFQYYRQRKKSGFTLNLTVDDTDYELLILHLPQYRHQIFHLHVTNFCRSFPKIADEKNLFIFFLNKTYHRRYLISKLTHYTYFFTLEKFT